MILDNLLLSAQFSDLYNGNHDHLSPMVAVRIK